MTSAPEPPSLRDTARLWFRLGCLAFGGQDDQVARLHTELVQRRRWLSARRFQHALDFCAVLPGPRAQLLAVYLGWLLHGLLGGLAAGLLFIAPALLLLTTLAWIYLNFGDTAALHAMHEAARPAVVAIVAAAAVRAGMRMPRHPWLWLLAAAAFAGTSVMSLPYPLVLLASAIGGSLAGRRHPGLVEPPPAVELPDPPGSCLIGNHDPPASHIRFRLGMSLAIVGLALLLGAAVALLAAVLLTGNGPAALQLAGFHAKAALVGFGADHAVLPYVYANAVNQYHWLTPDQMIDGLALAALVPGPMVMVVAFVGFVAGWTTQFAGEGLMLLSALCGALIASLFTLLPTSALVLAGAPFIEGTRHRVNLRGPLAGIGAAVTGVVCGLALVLAGQVFITRDQRFDWAPMAVAFVALVLALRWHLGSAKVVMLAAGCGLAWWWATGDPSGGLPAAR